MRSLRERYGGWALVTGASSGIGVEFARLLARDGLSCVLTARREDRLKTLAAELEREHGVGTRVIVADLGTLDGPDIVADGVADLPLALLVNNAGFGSGGSFSKLDPECLRRMVLVNCHAPVALTRRLVGEMIGRGRGAIVFVSSTTGCNPVPYEAVYSATKAFDLLLGESLFGELRAAGIDVSVVVPGTVDTEFQEVAQELPHGGDDPAGVASAGLRALGRRPSIIWGPWNRLQVNLGMRLLPRKPLIRICGEKARQVMRPEML